MSNYLENIRKKMYDELNVPNPKDLFELEEKLNKLKKELEKQKKEIEDIKNPSNADSLYKLGIYYEQIENNKELADKHWKLAIELDNTFVIKIANYYKEIKNEILTAIENEEDNDIIESYYEDIELCYGQIEKYYLIAVKKGNIDAIKYLGDYYKEIEDYEKMKIYYLTAFKKGNIDAIYNLGNYYRKIKDYDQMIKYYLMAIEKGCVNAMYNLGLYYENIKDYGLMKKYYLMAIEKSNTSAMSNLANYYKYIEIDDIQAKKYFLMINKD